ncbi:FliH/SctL family protein [Pseudoalteromonas byunsanensis]|uniref:Flagellar assembly protein FliH n=1 Tax=Pseudoalteromonas byunsanensis TaxID=327939 RepID=A0A1S1NCK4_9GAMM|nr:FliH/SctL family protein [Pseudoalteromonas byunsanensis]OHU97340.1 hypothetical protein BIW53_03185 [Pseudoalteromonas byunsanensis]
MIDSVKTYYGPKSSKPAVTESPIVTAVQQEAKPDARALLMAMESSERQQLIAELFQSDIETIVKTESERGYKEGLDKGVKEAQNLTSQRAEEIEKGLAEQQQQLDILLKNISALTPEIQLKDEEIYETITLAVFKLLGERLEQGTYLQQVVERAIEESLMSKSVVLCLSPEDHQLVQSHIQSQYAQQLQEKVVIKEDKRLSIGDTRLELANGCIESNFGEKLQVWCKNLVQLQRGTSVG